MCLITVLINKEYDDMKEGITNLRLNQFIEYFVTVYKILLSYCLKCRKIDKVKIQKLWRKKTED